MLSLYCTQTLLKVLHQARHSLVDDLVIESLVVILKNKAYSIAFLSLFKVLALIYIEQGYSLKELLLGLHGGAMGETCALALLAGGIYLLIRRVISWHTPVAFIGTVFVFTLILNLFGMEIDPVYHVLAGGLMLGAFFMATDYATSPATPFGQIVYGIGCGILTVLFRYFGLFPEGVTYAILMMNALVWVIDRYTAPRRFGTKKGGAAA